MPGCELSRLSGRFGGDSGRSSPAAEISCQQAAIIARQAAFGQKPTFGGFITQDPRGAFVPYC